MQNLTLLPLNLSKTCRVCLSESDDMISVFSVLFEQSAHKNSPLICEVLLSISSIKIEGSDCLPHMLCSICVKNARLVFNFQKQCNRSQAILDSCILNAQQLNTPEQDVDSSVIMTESRVIPDEVSTTCEDSKQEKVDDNLDCNSLSESDNHISHCILKVQTEETSSESAKSNMPKREIKTRKKRTIIRRGSKSYQLSIDELMSFYCKTIKENTVYQCNICDQSYKYSDSLVAHLQKHSAESSFKCGQCTKGFDSFQSLRFHQNTHSDEQPYDCKECGKRYKQTSTLTAHMRIHTGARPFLCSVCGRRFRQATDLRYHMRTHTKEKPYMCNICGRTMSMQCHLVQHIRTHTGEKPFKCTQCDKSFPSSTRLKRHLIVHSDLKPFTCEVCGKSFNRKSTLRVHAKIHTDERPFVCSVCQKGFIQAHALRSHILSHSSETADTQKKKP